MRRTLLALFAITMGLTGPSFAQAQLSSTNCLLPSGGVNIVTCGQNVSSALGPDVVITSFNYNQTNHTFTAVVKNQGTLATPANKVIGVGYFVDGQHRTWGNVNGPLAAGASVTVGTDLDDLNSGPYTIPNGTHTIKDWVDDVNRFVETNESNNQFTKLISISGEASTVNVQPTISGNPTTIVAKNTPYSFTPSASDTNGDTLTFAIQNKPAWATFNTSTGRITGTPTVTGTSSNIEISVTDGLSTAVSLPVFTIVVTSSLPPATSLKYNPGHYVTLSASQLDGNPVSFVETLKSNGVKGIVARYPWSSFEGAKDEYKYTRVNSHLNLLNSKGLKLIIFIDDKSFSGAAAVPSYLNTPTYTFVNKTGGISATRWNPYVAERFKALWKDMGENLDNHPALEGVVYSETAVSIPSGTNTTPSYDPVKYKQLIIDTLTVQSNAFPKSNVFWMMNFINNGYHNGVFYSNAKTDVFLGDIADAVLPLGVIMGGPDILPESASLVNRTYPYYTEFNNKGMKLFCSAQNDSFRHLHNLQLPFYTPLQIHNFAKNELHVNYIWWNHKTWVSSAADRLKLQEKLGMSTPFPTGEYKWSDAVPVIKNNPVINAN